MSAEANLDALNGIAGAKGSTLNLVNWRKARNSTLPQRAFLDLLSAQGPWVSGPDPLLKPRGGFVGGKAGKYTPYGLYGGAGFGGKSFCLRTAIVELAARNAAAGAPGLWGTLFCVEYDELRKRQIVEMIRDWEGDDENRAVGLGQLGKAYFSTSKGWVYEFYDKRLGGVFLRNITEGSRDPSRKLRGGNVVYALVDELTELNRAMFDALIYALRSNASNVRSLPFGGATNPDGVGHAWVRKLWIDRDFRGESRVIRPDDFRFVQAMPWDNPAFDEDVVARLAGNADPMLVRSRWQGDWNLNFGSRFSRFDRRVHVFEWDEFEDAYGGDMSFRELIKYPGLFEIYGSLDFGTAEESASAYYLHAVDPRGRVWTFAEWYPKGLFLEPQAEGILRLEDDWGVRPAIRYCDPSLKGKESDGINRWNKFMERGVRLRLGNNDRIEGWSTLDKFLYYKEQKNRDERIGPFWRIHSSCRELIRFLSEAPRGERNMEDVARTYRDDHPGDSVRYFLHSHFATSNLKVAYTPDMPGVYNQRVLDALGARR